MRWLYRNLPGGEFIWNRFHKHMWAYHVQNPSWDGPFISHRWCDICITHQHYTNVLLGYLDSIPAEWAWRDSAYCGHDLVGRLR